MDSRDLAADARTLEGLALSEWPEAAAARVDSVTVVGNRAEVALTVNDYGYWTYFQYGEQGWRETVTGNAPTVGWEDPRLIDWT